MPKNFRGKPSELCLKNIPVAKKFLYKRGEVKEYQDFPSKMFCLIQPKTFVEEPFSVSLLSAIEELFA